MGQVLLNYIPNEISVRSIWNVPSNDVISIIVTLSDAELDDYGVFDDAGDEPMGENPPPSQHSIPRALARYVSGTYVGNVFRPEGPRS